MLKSSSRPCQCDQQSTGMGVFTTSASTRQATEQQRDLYLLPPASFPPTITIGDRPPYGTYYDQPLSKVNVTTTTAFGYSYASLFTLTSPATLRQPYYTAANAYVEKSRHWFWNFYKYPVVYSEFGAESPSTLEPLDNPIPAVQVSNSPDKSLLKQEASEAMTTTYPTVWGATRTTTFVTSVTAEPGDVIFLRFPVQTPPPPTEYTTLPAPSDPGAKGYPNGLPILILTQVNGVIFDPQSTTLTTATVVQQLPPGFSTDINDGKLALVSPSYKWSTWTSAERGGVVAAAVLSGLVLITLFVYTCMLRRKKKHGDEEVKHERSHGWIRMLIGGLRASVMNKGSPNPKPRASGAGIVRKGSRRGASRAKAEEEIAMKNAGDIREPGGEGDRESHSP